MQGPYCRLLPLCEPGSMLAIPHHSDQLHILKLTSDVSILYNLIQYLQLFLTLTIGCYFNFEIVEHDALFRLSK